MATFTKVKLSGSTDGRGIKIAATATAGTTVHTADSTALDEIWLYLYNSDTSDIIATVEFGGTTAPDDNIKVTVPYQGGLVLVVPGLILTNSVVVKVFAGTANKIVATGFVNRIT